MTLQHNVQRNLSLIGRHLVAYDLAQILKERVVPTIFVEGTAFLFEGNTFLCEYLENGKKWFTPLDSTF